MIVCVAVVGPEVQASLTLETGLSDREANMRHFAQALLRLFEQQLQLIG